MREVTGAQWCLCAAVVLAVLLPLPGAARALETAILDPVQPEMALEPWSETAIEPARGWDLEAAAEAMAAGRGQAFDIHTIVHDLQGATHWLRTRLRNGAGVPGRWILDTNLRNVPLLEIYAVRDGGVDLLLRHDGTRPFEARPLDHRTLAVPLVLAPGEAVDVFLRVRFGTDLELDYTAQDAESFAVANGHEMAKYMVFHGFILCVAVVAVAISIALANRAALYYAGYVSAILLWCLYLDGLAFQYLWPRWPEFNVQALRPLQVAIPFFGALFARELFSLAERHRSLDRLYLGIIGALCLFALSSLISEHRVLTGIAFVFIVGSAQVYFVTAIIAVRRGWPGAVPFLIGATAVSIATLAAIAVHAVPTLAPLEASRDLGRIGFVIESLAFLAAIGMRVVQIRREHSASQAQAIAALERQLALSEDLRRADENHRRALALAEDRRNAMAFATHDLRQPLNSMRLTVERLSRLPSGDRETLQRHCAYIEDLVNEYLDVSTGGGETAPDPEAAAANGTTEAFAADLLIDTVYSMYSDEAREKGLRLRRRSSAAMVVADPMAAMRCLSNLVANAVAHTATGGVLIGCRPCQGRVAFAVYDTGPGMTPSEIGRLRQRGIKGATSQGKGIGLAVVDELAAAHGFGFEIRSDAGRGSCFMLLLPRAAA